LFFEVFLEVVLVGETDPFLVEVERSGGDVEGGGG
jgi:hypothetical protein